MSQFLGRQDSIESLRKDVVDLQGALLDVFSRTGPVRFTSWKFPDKLSCNLDMVALLEKYDFVDGEDAYNQHSHIVLLELLLLLLQSLNAYVEKIRCSHRRDQTQQKGCLSVGLVVRNYWSNLVQFANLKESYKDTKKQRKPLLVAVEDTLELGHMTAGDVAQWANEQLRDMRRLMKHLQEVRSTVQPLKERLAAAEAERDRFKSQLERKQKTFKQEMEKHQANIVQLEFSLTKAQRCVKETEQRLQEEQRQLKRETLSMEESHSRLKEKEALWQDALQTLEFENNGLQEKVRALHIEQEACGKLQQRIQELESQICKTQLRLDKENAKYQSACRQQESMQAKQKSLLERVNALDEECEELQGQVGDREERQIVLHNQLLQMSEEKEQMQGQLTQQQDLCSELRREKQTQETHAGELKNSVAELKEYVQALRERERLLVAFPELNPTAQPQSTGNVLLDMEQQLQANNIRINLLEQENLTLYTSLVKLRERAQHNATGEASPQQTRVLSPSGPSLEKQHHPLTQMQKRSLQSSSAARLGYGNRGKDAQRGESGLESAGSEDRVSPASPYPLHLHLQTLQLDTGSTAVKSQTKTPSSALLSHSRGSNQRKKIKP
ncbi:hypothetical protein JOQ06_019505 [Pogonophryne albipinna]|uniref:Coiled-coil domain-containing protein 157 n=1 Tax=Pogonophryne albipinna TaxID=1090488 RepID=A0AAD6ACM3_9TELE|nr:hypothetical protein JOQ06_019505 [Pogonophryne albipinna]